MSKSGFISILQYDERTLTRARVKPGAEGIEFVSFDQERGRWPASGGQLEAAVAQFVGRLQLGDDAIVTVLPRQHVTVRILNLPTHDDAEAANMIRFSAEEYVPYPAEELVIQQAILRREPGGESKVLAALAHRDVLSAHLAPLRAAGIIPERVMLSTVCLANAVAAAAPRADDPYALVNLGSSGLEVLVFQHGKLLSARGVVSEQDWSLSGAGAGDADDEIAVEVRGALSAFRRESEDGLGADAIYLGADYPIALEERAEALAANTGKDCATARFADALLKGQPATLTLIGAALEAQKRAALEVNLLPAEASRERSVAGAKVLLRRAGIAAGVVAASLLLLFVQAYWQRSAYLADLRGQLGKIEPDARGLSQKQEQLRILRQQMKRGNFPLHMLAVTAAAAPAKAANIVQFRYNINAGVDLFGRATSVDDVQRFASNLRKASIDSQLGFFQNAHSVYEDRGDERGTPIVMFQVTVPVETESDAKKKEEGGEGGATLPGKKDDSVPPASDKAEPVDDGNAAPAEQAAPAAPAGGPQS